MLIKRRGHLHRQRDARRTWRNVGQTRLLSASRVSRVDLHCILAASFLLAIASRLSHRASWRQRSSPSSRATRADRAEVPRVFPPRDTGTAALSNLDFNAAAWEQARRGFRFVRECASAINYS